MDGKGKTEMGRGGGTVRGERERKGKETLGKGREGWT